MCMPSRPVGICGLLPYPCGLMSWWAFVLWAFVRIPRRLHLIDSGMFSLGGGHITASTSVRDLGVYFDRDMSMTTQSRQPFRQQFILPVTSHQNHPYRRSLHTTTAITVVNIIAS